MLAFVAVGCGGSTESTVEGAGPEATTGGELEGTAAVEPLVRRTTTPIPVPQPVTPREELSEPLQQLWTRVEEAVEIRPPEPPSDATEEAIDAWAVGPFTEWFRARMAADASVADLVATLGDDTAEARVLAATLYAYMNEDLASGLRGAPIPADIAAEPELLAIYIHTLDTLLRPVALESAKAYAVCVGLVVEMGEESPHLPWGLYCQQHGAEVVEVFELASEPSEVEPAAVPGA